MHALDAPHLCGLLPAELAGHLRAQGIACDEPAARKVLAEVVQRGKDVIAPRRPVSRAVIEGASAMPRARLEVVERVADPDDGFVKYLLRSPDGALTEAVRIPLLKPGCFTVCLSSQVGCAMQCVFCATGRLGLVRNLRAWEMVSAFLCVRDDAPGRVTGAVFQGQGEPLHNYDAVMRAAAILSAPWGGAIAAEAITISTVGLLPALRRYTAEGQPYRLIVSLTSADPARRASLLPVAGKFALDELGEAIAQHARSRKGLTTVAWVMLSGVNTGDDEVRRLQALLPGVPMRFNLIDVNDARPDGYRPPDDAERAHFIDALQALRVPIVRRYSGGKNRHAACGMLAATRYGGGAADPADEAAPATS